MKHIKGIVQIVVAVATVASLFIGLGELGALAMQERNLSRDGPQWGCSPASLVLH